MSIRLVAGLMLMGCIRDAAPSISSVLARFEPTTLPIAMPPLPSIPAMRLTTSSGHRGADAHDGESDEKFGHPVAFGDRYRAVDQAVGPRDDEDESQNQ